MNLTLVPYTDNYTPLALMELYLNHLLFLIIFIIILIYLYYKYNIYK